MTFLSLIIAAAAAQTGRAEVTIKGTAAEVRVTTDGDRLSDVLSALKTAFNTKYRSSVPLDRVITGTYSGQLSQVISRLLDGYNFVQRVDKESIDVIVMDQGGGPEVARSARAAPAVPSPAPPAGPVASGQPAARPPAPRIEAAGADPAQAVPAMTMSPANPPARPPAPRVETSVANSRRATPAVSPPSAGPAVLAVPGLPVTPPGARPFIGPGIQ